MNELQMHLRRFGQRLRLRDGWLLAQRSLWLAGLAAALVLLAGRLWPLEYSRQAALALPGLWLLAVLGLTLLRRESLLQTALRVDRELHLKERLSTSLLLSGGGQTLTSSQEMAARAFAPELVSNLHADALARARPIEPSQAFPLPWLKRPLLMAAGFAIAAALLAFLPNPMDQVLAERRAVAQAAQQQAQQIEKLKEEIQKAELAPEERQELLRRLEELARQLRENRGDRQAALSDLAKFEEALRQRLQPNASARQAALEAFAAQLRALSKDPTSRQAGDLEAAAQDLLKLADQADQLSESQRQELSQALAQMASRAGQAGDAALAQALAELSQALQSGDAQAAQNAAQKGAQALRDAARQLAGQKAIQQALAQAQSSRQAIAQAGQRAQGPGSSAPGQGQNQGQGPGQSGNPGQGQNPGGQQPGSGGGSQANTLPPFRGGRTQVNPPRGSKAGSTGADLAQQVYAPQTRPGSQNELFIPGQDTGQGTIEEKEAKDPLPGSDNPALVPYQQVFQDYLDAANQAIDQSYIPAGLKDYVRKYFEQLEP